MLQFCSNLNLSSLAFIQTVAELDDSPKEIKSLKKERDDARNEIQSSKEERGDARNEIKSLKEKIEQEK